MAAFVRRADLALLGAYTSFAYLVQRRTGLTSYFLAAVVALLFLGTIAVEIANVRVPLLDYAPYGPAWIVVMGQAFWLSIFWKVMLAEASRRNDAFLADPVRFVPPQRTAFSWVRPLWQVAGFVWLFLHPGASVAGHAGVAGWVLYHRSSMLFIAAFHYLMSVVPLPPASETAGAWWFAVPARSLADPRT